MAPSTEQASARDWVRSSLITAKNELERHAHTLSLGERKVGEKARVWGGEEAGGDDIF